MTTVVQPFLYLKKFLAGQRIQNDIEAEMSVKQCFGSNPRLQTSTTQGYESWCHSMTNVSIPEVNMLKNNSALTLFVLINIFIIFFCKGPMETYFVDALRI